MARKGAGRIVSQSELASIVGVTPQTIRAWVAAGCPVVEAGGNGAASRLNTADVIAWREKQVAARASGDGSGAHVDYLEAKRRKEVALAVLAEIEADLKRGTVVLIDDVTAAVSAEYARVRTRILSVGSKVAPRAAVLADAAEVKALIDGEVATALAELTRDAAS